jgi:hypothetical protein
MYDVYFTTGIGKISTGVDIWVNNWLSEVSKDLNTQPVLLIYRTKPTDFNFEIPIEHYWYNDETGNHRDIFEEKFRECRRANILHAHYTPLELIEENKDKIHSYIIHNCLDKVVVETGISDLPFGWTPYYSQKWESEILSYAKNKVWIGLYELKGEKFEGAVNIPSYYEFTHNKELSNSNSIGFTARCESRKNPHYLDQLEGFMFTNIRTFQKTWKHTTDINFKNLKQIQYESPFEEIYYSMDWGISHCAFSAEPFGFSIFQSLDWGKLPIISKDWCEDIPYKFRAGSKEEFKDIYDSIGYLSYEEKKEEFDKFKYLLAQRFDTKQNWKEQLTNLYNA